MSQWDLQPFSAHLFEIIGLMTGEEAYRAEKSRVISSICWTPITILMLLNFLIFTLRDY